MQSIFSEYVTLGPPPSEEESSSSSELKAAFLLYGMVLMLDNLSKETWYYVEATCASNSCRSSTQQTHFCEAFFHSSTSLAKV